MKRMIWMISLIILMSACSNTENTVDIEVTEEYQFMEIDKVRSGEASAQKTKNIQDREVMKRIIEQVNDLPVKTIEDQQKTFNQLRQETVFFFWFTEEDWFSDLSKVRDSQQPVYTFIAKPDGTFYLGDPTKESKKISFVTKEKHPELFQQFQKELDLNF